MSLNFIAEMSYEKESGRKSSFDYSNYYGKKHCLSAEAVLWFQKVKNPCQNQMTYQINTVKAHQLS